MGGILHRRASKNMEFNSRLRRALMALKKMETFWNDATCIDKRKINVYYAVVGSKLIFGLESLHIAENVWTTSILISIDD